MQGLDALVLLLNSDRTDCASGVDSLRLLLEHLGGLVDDLFQRLFEPWEDDIIQVLSHLNWHMKMAKSMSLQEKNWKLFIYNYKSEIGIC